MNFQYFIKFQGKIYDRSVVVPDIDSYYRFIDERNVFHKFKQTGISFHSA